MSQIETTKVVAYVATGPDGDEAAVSKVVAYMVLFPGSTAGDDQTRAHCVFSNVVRRP